MIKKIISILWIILLLCVPTFAATDITQELDNKWWTLKINNFLTINYEDETFNEIVVFNARTVSQLEWGIDSSKYDDKWAEVLYISFKNTIWLTTTPEKNISFWYNNLQNYTYPVLLTYKNNKLTVIKWEDNAWTYVFNVNDSIDWAYKIVDDLNWSTSLISDTVDLLWATTDDSIEFNSAWEEDVEVLLSDLPSKWINDYYLIMLWLFLFIIFAIGHKAYRNT